MKRYALVASAVLIVLGAFWTGRESGHGLTALWEHWWCPLPLVAIFLGAVMGLGAAYLTRRPSSAA